MIKKPQSWSNIFAVSILMLLIVFNYFSNENIYEHTVKQALFYFVPSLILIVVNNIVLIPRLLDRKLFKFYGVSLFLLIILTQAATGYFTIPHYFNMQIGVLIFDFTKYFTTATAGFGIILLQRLSGQEKQNYEQQFLIQQTELKALKSQINPHFLFNNLNNIYYLCLERSEKAAELVEKLSTLMRYTLENSKLEFVSLEKEFEFINNYIELEKSRLKSTKMIKINKEGNFMNVKIAPLILITFVENCFKHGSNTTNGEPEIEIFMNFKNGELLFYAENKKFALNINHGKSETGLNNVKTRLGLIYPSRHTLNIENTADKYTVSLLIQINGEP